jgi:hypothetical protein
LALLLLLQVVQRNAAVGLKEHLAAAAAAFVRCKLHMNQHTLQCAVNYGWEALLASLGA